MTQRAKEYLESMAPLANFWVQRGSNIEPGLIHYKTPDGQLWTLMEDDEALLDECLQLLADSDCPFFSDEQAMMEHVEKLKG